MSHSRNHCCGEKPVGITFFECVLVALVKKHAKRNRRVILSSVSWLDL
jgi:hypothetical protein